MSKAVKNLSQPAAQAPQKPASKRLAKKQDLLGQELQAHYVEVGLTSLEDIRFSWLALRAIMLEHLWSDDENTQRIGHILHFPVRRLGECVKEFPDLQTARKKLEDLHAVNTKDRDPNKDHGPRLVDAEMRDFLRS